MLPLLRFMGDRQEHSVREIVDALSAEFQLTEAERRQLLPSGVQPVMSNRVAWARAHMGMAGLLEKMRHGFHQITDRGRKILSENPKRIDLKFLTQFEEYREFRKPRAKAGETDEAKHSDDATTPQEALERAYINIRSELASELLTQIKQSPPILFERMVVELLVKMGYGGSRKDAGRAVGSSGDEGIDGIIKEDRLGLDIIYIQAKRWQGTVCRPEIQKFAGALQGQRARKGIFITTSDFSSEAEEYAARIENKIVLIDGEQLAQMLIDHNIGVAPIANYEVKRIDSDYFTEQ